MQLAACIFAILSLSALAAAFPTKRQITSSTENDLLNGSPCKAVLIIYARGTTEAGNVGTSTGVGDTFFNALIKDIGQANVAIQGVAYPASVAGFLEGGDPTGSTTMASLVAQAFTQCPSSKVVMAGYSQGGQLVHNAAKQLTAAQAAQVNSVVIFGDPDDGQAVGAIAASKVLVICHTGDNICQGGDTVRPAHLDYQMDAGTAATFVRGKVGL